MEITGTNSYMDVEYNGKTARFDGELVIDGFCAYKDSAHWLPPHEGKLITIKEINDIIAAVRIETVNKEVKIYFE